MPAPVTSGDLGSARRDGQTDRTTEVLVGRAAREHPDMFFVVKAGRPAKISGDGGRGGNSGNGFRALSYECDKPGRGGHGGNGGNGGDGGSGSKLVVCAASQDVLDALEITVEGGKAGVGGKGGKVAVCANGTGDEGFSGDIGEPGKPGTLETKIVPAAKLTLIRKYLAAHPDMRLAQ